MPYENDYVADVDGESLRCWVCDGNLRPETTIDLHTGFSPRRCFVSFVVVGGLAVSRQDRSLPPERPVQKEKAQQPMLLLSLSTNTCCSSSSKKGNAP